MKDEAKKNRKGRDVGLRIADWGCGMADVGWRIVGMGWGKWMKIGKCTF
jgi:hypothetical protein